jgi:hypothetical protein
MVKVLGTPLPSVEADSQRFVPEWKQEARDEQGRKHFHGAFTGGREAGYHNTVGSREGWEPTTFTSSRNRQSVKRKATVEDYMDEEDMRDLQRDVQLVATETFQRPMTGGLVAKQGLGWSILRKLGWQEGDGVEDKGPAAQILQLAQQKTRAAPVKASVDRTGLGLSVLEDEDEDIYGTNRTAYLHSINVDTISPSVQKWRSFSGECLDGFVPGLAIKEEDSEQYQAPIVPKDFVPKGLGLGMEKTPLVVNQQLTVEERGKMLGEKVRQTREETGTKQVITLDVTTAMAAQRAFMPFQSNLAKDARYRQFLAHFVSPLTDPLPIRPTGMSKAEHQREQLEFVRSASIYRPLPGMMAAKFVSSNKGATLDMSSGSKAGLYRPEPRKEEELERTVDEREESRGIEDRLEEIAREGLLPYGKETRTEVMWIPSTILCQRYGIEPPHKDVPDVEGPMAVKPALDLQSMHSIVSASSYADKVDLSALEREEENNVGENVVEITENLDRPAMHVFYNIFGEKSDSIDDEQKVDETPLTLKTLQAADSDLASQSNTENRRHQGPTMPPKMDLTALVDSSQGPETQESIVTRSPRTIKPTPSANTVKIHPDDDDDQVEVVAIKKRRPNAIDFW